MEKNKIIIIVTLLVLAVSFVVFRLSSITGYVVYEFNDIVANRTQETGDTGLFGYVDGIWIESSQINFVGWAHDYDHLNNPVTLKFYFKDIYLGETIANLPQWAVEFGTWENELLSNLDMRYEFSYNIDPVIFAAYTESDYLDYTNYKIKAYDVDTQIYYDVEKHGEAFNPEMI